MKKEMKAQVIENISAELKQYPNFYLTDIEGLNAGKTSQLRRECFNEGIKLEVVKNTLLAHVLKASGNEDLISLTEILKGNTAIMFCETPNAPAKLIKKWQKANEAKPQLKGAYVQECAYIGADKLEALVNVKSKNELIADVVALLQSPIKHVIGALQSAPQTVAGLVKTLEER